MKSIITTIASILCTISLICITSIAVAEEEIKTEAENAEAKDSTTDKQESDGALNKFLKDQLIKAEKERKLSEDEEYKALIEKYELLGIPLRRSYPSAMHMELVYDSSFVNTVFFAPGSSYISDVQEDKLRTILDNMIEQPTFNLIIDGHSSFNTQIEDLEKRTFYNRWISGRRSVKVLNFFTENGINPTRIAAFAFGSEQPLNGEDNTREINQNRRVELRLTNQPIQLINANNKKSKKKK